MNDDELKQALQQWKAPDAPESLQRRVLREPWWRWLLTGSVRIPVPALIAAAVFVIAFYAARAGRTPISCASGVGTLKYVAMVVCDAPAHRLNSSVL